MTPRRRLIAIVSGATAVAVPLIAASSLGGRTEAAPAPVPVQRVAWLAGVAQHGAVLGSPRAPVTLVEFADLQCPYCGEWARTALPDLVDRYVRSGQVKIVFRGLAFLGPDSLTALRAAVAAGERNRLWNVVELLYQHQGTENSGWVSDELLRSIGASAESTPAVEATVAAAAREARTAGVDSTPAFFAGRSGSTLRRLDVRSLDAAGIAPLLDALLGQ